MDKLTRSRRAQRGQIYKLITRAEPILEVKRPSQELQDTLASIVENLQSKLELILKTDSQIADKVDDDMYEAEIAYADDYALDISEKIFKMKKFLERSNCNFSGNNVNVSTPITSSSTTSAPIKLPTLSLIKFDGTIIDWLNFRDSFDSAVTSNHALSDVQKFQYLKSNLVGEAAQVISGLTLSSANFKHALDLLEQRYGDKNKIITAHMRALWDLPNPTNTACSLREFFDELESLVRGLRTLGKTEDSYGDLLVPMILNKLPTNTKRQMSRYHGSTNYDLKTLKEAIQREIEILQVDDVSETQHTVERATASAFHTKAQNRLKFEPKSFSCAYCKGKHSPINCEVVKDTSKRHAIAKKNKLCFNCLSPTHRAKDCRSIRRCKKCERKHHTSLCQPNPRVTTRNDTRASSSDLDRNDPKPITHANFTASRNRQPVLLKTAESMVFSRSKGINAYILFDEGSSKSFITAELTQKLQLKPIRKDIINLAVFGEDECSTKTYDIVSFDLLTKENSLVSVEAVVVPQISTKMTDFLTHDVRNLPHLKGLELAHPKLSLSEFTVSILIGADQFWNLVGDHIVKGNGPTAISSKLGYLLSGPCYNSNSNSFPSCDRGFHIHASSDVTAMWDLETLGISDPLLESKSYSDLETFSSNFLEKRETSYYAKLPWKPDHPPLPTNYRAVASRTRNMIRKLPETTKSTYNRIIEDQESRGFIEKTDSDVRVGHYLPHHAVKKDSLTTPIRIVYDCSFKESSDNPSLNDCLDKGPDLLNELLGILLRFRLPRFAFTSDIEKAFLNVKLDERDRDFTKFLWLSDLSNPESDFITYRFASVLFGSVSSPAILNAVLRTHLNAHESDVSNKLKNNIYVDNVVSGCDTTTDTLRTYDSVNELIESAGFKLRGWASNCDELRETAKMTACSTRITPFLCLDCNGTR